MMQISWNIDVTTMLVALLGAANAYLIRTFQSFKSEFKASLIESELETLKTMEDKLKHYVDSQVCEAHRTAEQRASEALSEQVTSLRDWCHAIDGLPREVQALGGRLDRLEERV